MKILIHSAWGIQPDFVGGTERFILDLAKGFQKKGAEVFIVCSNLQEEIEIEGVRVIGIIPKKYKRLIIKYGYANEKFFKQEIICEPFSIDSIKRFSQYVSQQLESFDVDVVILNSFLYSAFLNNSLPLNKMIVINHESPKELLNYWGNNAFEILVKTIKLKSSTLRKIKILAVPSKYYARLFSRTFNLQVIPIPLGINTEKFSKYTLDKKLRTKYCSKYETLILLPARFDIKQKGHDIALRALSVVKKKNYRFKVIFTGYDQEAYSQNKKILDKLLKKYDLKNEVILTKFKNILEAFSICDFVISPERFASYGIAISESLALGIPTIVSPIPSYKEITEGYKHAYVTKKNSSEYLEKEIISLMENKFKNNPIEGKRFRENNDFQKCVDIYYLKCKSLHLKGIIFDMDGVIVNSEYHWEHAEGQYLKSLIPSWNKYKQTKIIGFGQKDLYNYLNLIYNLQVPRKDFFNEYNSMAKEIYLKKVVLSPYFKKLINKAKTSKIILGLASSSSRLWINMVLSRFKLGDFNYSISAEEINGASKPSPEIYLNTLKKLNLNQNSCIVIEDSKNGVISAKNAGLYCIGYRNGYNDSQDFSSADIIIQDFSELLEGKLKIFVE